MAQNIEAKVREMTLNLHVTGDNQKAVATCIMHTGSGLERVETTVEIGMHQAALKALINMLSGHVKAKNMEIGLTTSSCYLIKMLGDGEFKRMTPVERLAKLGAEEVQLWNTLAKVLKLNGNTLKMTGELDTEELERAKYTALWKLHAIQEAEAAANVASSKEELEVAEA